MLDKLKVWLQVSVLELLSKAQLIGAIRASTLRRPAPTRYRDDGTLEFDNNAAE